MYHEYASSIGWSLPSTVISPGDNVLAGHRNVVLVDDSPSDRDLGRKIVFRDDTDTSREEERAWSPMGQFRDQLQSDPRRVQVWDQNSPVQITRTVQQSPPKKSRWSSPVRSPSRSSTILSNTSRRSPTGRSSKSPIRSHSRRSSERSASRRSRSRDRRRSRSRSRDRRRSRSRSRNRRRSRSRNRDRKRSRSRSRERRRSRSRDRKRRRSRSRSRKRSPSPSEVVKKINFEDCQILKKQMFKDSAIGIILSFVNDEMGIIKLDRQLVGGVEVTNTVRHIFFHVDQFYIRSKERGVHPFGEVFRNRDMKKHLWTGQIVYCNVRKLYDEKPKSSLAEGQAIVVCLRDADYKEWCQNTFELSEKDKSWMEFNLDHNKSIMLNFDNKQVPLMDPFFHSIHNEIKEGKVIEYIGLESGLIELSVGEKGVVLFDMRQVFLVQRNEKGNKWKRLKNYQDKKILRDIFPIGSVVDLIITRLPCHENSKLKYQAVAVFQQTFIDIEPPLNDFHLRYNTLGSKIALQNSLLKQHEQFKHFSQLKFTVNLTSKSMVHAVLDELPTTWQAHIIAEFGDFGLIRITSKTGGVLNAELSPNLQYFNVLYHKEDLFDHNGQQIIYTTSVDKIQSLLGTEVELTARSICKRNSPEGIIKVVTEMVADNPANIGIPVLQAITVKLKSSQSANTQLNSNIPKPTALCKNVPSLSMGSPFTHCFLQYGLKTRLDIKILQYHSEKDKPPLDYKAHIIAKYEYPEEKRVVEELENLDSEATRKLVFGGIDLSIIDQAKQANLPQEISRIECEIVYLHRIGMRCDRGAVLVKPLVDNAPVPCYAYFQYNDLCKLRNSEIYCRDPNKLNYS